MDWESSYQQNQKWIEWARELQAIAQTGIYFSEHRQDSAGIDGSPYYQIRKIVAEMIAIHSDADIGYISGLLENMSGIATPQAALSGAVFRDDAILLVKVQEKDSWKLPGEFSEFNDTMGQTLTRAIEEETGYQTQVVKMVAVYDQQQPPFIHRYHLVFKCEIVGGRSASRHQVDLMDFYKEAKLPTLAIEGLTARQISQLFEHDRNPSLPTDFD